MTAMTVIPPSGSQRAGSGDGSTGLTGRWRRYPFRRSCMYVADDSEDLVRSVGAGLEDVADVVRMIGHNELDRGLARREPSSNILFCDVLALHYGAVAGQAPRVLTPQASGQRIAGADHCDVVACPQRGDVGVAVTAEIKKRDLG